MQLELYFRLGTPSRRAIVKTVGAHGRPKSYRPRGDLLKRLSRETGLSKSEVALQLQRERQWLLDQQS